MADGSWILRGKHARVLTVVLAAQALLFYTANHGRSTPLAKPLSAFPREIGPWRMASEGVVEKDVQDVLRADDTLTRWYVDGNKGASLFIAYFQTTQYGQAPHSPKNCLPGSGWTPSQTGYLTLPVPGRAEPIQINRYLVAKGDEKSAVLYWYQSHGRVIAGEFSARFWLAADSIRQHRSDTSLVRVVVPVGPGGDQDAVDTGVKFVRAIFPILSQYLPS